MWFKKILPSLSLKSFNVETINFTEKRIGIALLGSCHLTRNKLEHAKWVPVFLLF